MRMTSKLFFGMIVVFITMGCGARTTTSFIVQPPLIQPNSGQKIHWFGPDHPEDFVKFGGISGYIIHWSTSSKENVSSVLCGSILDEHGRPEDKYENRITIPATHPGCKSNAVVEFVPGHPELGTRLYTHECTVTPTGLPTDTLLYVTVSAYIENSNWMDYQYWGCPCKEFTMTIPGAGH